MKTFTVTVSFGDPIVEFDLALLLRDALGEFIANRSTPEDYVESRYAGMSAQFKADKVERVQVRNIMAHHLIHEMVIEQVIPAVEAKEAK